MSRSRCLVAAPQPAANANPRAQRSFEGLDARSAKMASSSVDPKPLLWYYVRQGFARTVISTVDESLKRRGTDSTLTFWKAVALSREGEYVFGLATYATECAGPACGLSRLHLTVRITLSNSSPSAMQAISLALFARSRRCAVAAMQSFPHCWPCGPSTAPRRQRTSGTAPQHSLTLMPHYPALASARCRQAMSSQASSCC